MASRTPVPDVHGPLTLGELHTLSYAAAFIRGVAANADSIAVTLPALDGAAADGLERACALAVVTGTLEIEIRFESATTTVRVARPGRL